MTQKWEIKVLYDGECPLCMREIGFLERRDRQRGRIAVEDISDPSFDPSAYGRNAEQLMSRIHAVLPSGELVEGVEVFRQLYSAIGFRRLVTLTRLPGLSHLLGLVYALFANNRLRLTGRCADDSCAIPASSP